MTVKTKYAQLGIWTIQKDVADNFGGDEAESDAVAAIAEGEEAEGEFFVGADVGQAVFGFAEDAGPGAVGLYLDVEHFAKFFAEGGGFGGNELVARFRIDEGLVFVADHGAMAGAPAGVEIRPRSFPDEGFFNVDGLLDGKTRDGVGGFEGDDFLVEELGCFVAGGEDDAAAGDGGAVLSDKRYAVGGGERLGDMGVGEDFKTLLIGALEEALVEAIGIDLAAVAGEEGGGALEAEAIFDF